MKKKIMFISGILIVILATLHINQNNIAGFLLERELNKINNDQTEEDNLQGYDKPVYNNEIEEFSIENYFKNQGKFKNVKISGRLVVPSIGMNLPILEGTSNTNLLLGASEQLPREEISMGGNGNYILASHKMSEKRNIGFSQLHKCRVKDLIYTTNKDKVYIYETIKSLKVKNADIEYLKNTKEPLITLYTCSKFGKNTDKIVVQGKLINSKRLNELNNIEFDLLFKKDKK